MEICLFRPLFDLLTGIGQSHVCAFTYAGDVSVVSESRL